MSSYNHDGMKNVSGKNVSGDAQCSETDFGVHYFFCAIFSYCDMVKFVFNSG